MGWESRNYGSEGEGNGGFRSALRRVFGDGENPLTWGFPLYRAWGILVRVHIFFVLFIVGQLIWSLGQNRIGFPYMVIGMVSLFVLVLLHEYGHCIACRRVGGTADQIMMWPLGGLAFCAPPHRWRADLITTIGGPAVNLVLWPVLGGLILALGFGRHAVLFNPFDPGLAIGEVVSNPMVAGHTAVVRYGALFLWWLYYTNAALFLFNMLLFMYPMDAGRIVHALLWRKMGYRRATFVVVRMGLFFAIALFIGAVIFGNTLLMGIALFGGLTCWVEDRRLRMTAGDPALEGYDFERGYQGLPDEDEEAPERRSERRRQKEEEDQQELDRILAKIASSGMGSLTRGEKRWLERATERRRRV